LLVAGGAVAAVLTLTGGGGGGSSSSPSHETTNATTEAAAVGGAGTTATDQQGGPTFNSRISSIVNGIVPAQATITSLVRALRPTPQSFAAVRRAADTLEQAVLRAQGTADALSPGGPGENAAKRSLLDALAKQSRYARSLRDLPAPSALAPARAGSLVSQAAEVRIAYTILRNQTGGPCCTPMPAGADAAQRFVAVARNRQTPAGLGLFVDRIEGFLNQSTSGRAELVSALGAAMNCSTYPEQASGRVASVVENRQSLLDQLASVQAPTPQAARIVSLLQVSLSHSIAADRHYRDWLASLSGSSSCPLPQTGDYRLARSEDAQASVAKREFIAAFNPLASKFQRRTWSESEF
jgi:hypothetical protein